jgi:hypothetical protein
VSAAWVTEDQLLIEQIQADWAGIYDVGYAAGEFWAFRLIGGQPLTADTPAGIESAIRADFVRWVAP